MKNRTLGKTGYSVSAIGFGAWAIGATSWGKQDDNDSVKALHEADFRSKYFAGDRMERVVERVGRVREDFPDHNLAQLALRFALQHPGVSTVIAGIRNPRHAGLNLPVADLPPLSDETMLKLRQHAWLKQFWHSY